MNWAEWGWFECVGVFGRTIQPGAAGAAGAGAGALQPVVARRGGRSRGNGQCERRRKIDLASSDISPFFPYCFFFCVYFFFFVTGARTSVSPWQEAHKRFFFLKNLPPPGAP